MSDVLHSVVVDVAAATIEEEIFLPSDYDSNEECITAAASYGAEMLSRGHRARMTVYFISGNKYQVIAPVNGGWAESASLADLPVD